MEGDLLSSLTVGKKRIYRLLPLVLYRAKDNSGELELEGVKENGNHFLIPWPWCHQLPRERLTQVMAGEKKYTHIIIKMRTF